MLERAGGRYSLNAAVMRSLIYIHGLKVSPPTQDTAVTQNLLSGGGPACLPEKICAFPLVESVRYRWRNIGRACIPKKCSLVRPRHVDYTPYAACSRINFWCSGANLVHCLEGRCTRFLSCYPSARDTHPAWTRALNQTLYRPWLRHNLQPHCWRLSALCADSVLQKCLYWKLDEKL